MKSLARFVAFVVVLGFGAADVAAQQLITVQAANTQLSNCIPFGGWTDENYMGFVYRNIPAFDLQPGEQRIVWFAIVGGENRAAFDLHVTQATATARVIEED